MASDVSYDRPGPSSFEWWRAPSRRLEVRWLGTWTRQADEALAALPPMRNCPSDLFRMVMMNTDGAKKRCALILKGGAPVALIGLRHRGGRRWQLVTDREVSPRSWAPAAPGFLLPSLRALQCDVELTEWDRPLPELARAPIRYPLYRTDLRTDYRARWRDVNQGFERRLRQAEQRTRKFAFEIDSAGIADWTIRTWSERWGEQSASSDVMLAADYHFNRGHLHSFALCDKGAPCAGLTAFADGDDLIFLTTARLFAYESFGVGTRLLELVINWASAEGFNTFTLGSGRIDSYKRWWGPAAGDAWTFSVRPAAMDLLKRGKAALLATRERVSTVARSRAAARPG